VYTQIGSIGQATIPSAPAGFDPASLFQGIYWHQRWEIFPGVFVPGHNDVGKICDAMRLPLDLSGKRVLDVGAWHGCFSFECERRGAKEVVALSLEKPDEVGFDRIKDVLGSRVRYVNGSTYTMSREEIGTFDVVLFLGVLYHLRYPLLAIDRLRGVCSGDIYVESHVIDHHRWLRGGLKVLNRLVGMDLALRDTPIWRQYLAYELGAKDQSNWFGPNVVAVKEAFESAGFQMEHTKSWNDRAAFHGKAVKIPDRIASQLTYEGFAANVDLVGLQKASRAQQD